jgi:UDP-N-acetylglucosamine 2-epimerase
MLSGIEDVLFKEKPDVVLVYGDTNSTLAGALAAVKLLIPVAHVEAGLRSFNRMMPEEINRLLTDHVSELLFCPTQTAVANLEAEGIREGVHSVGDVMYDATLQNAQVAQRRSQALESSNVSREGYLLATVHRPRNTDDPERLSAILSALDRADETVVFPAHPRTRQAIERAEIPVGRQVRLLEPVSYLDMLQLINNARKVLTDSGGVQKEAYFLGTPCITLREETEWVETLIGGWNVLAGADADRIVTLVQEHAPDGEREEVFGDGTASLKIVSILDQAGES